MMPEPDDPANDDADRTRIAAAIDSRDGALTTELRAIAADAAGKAGAPVALVTFIAGHSAWIRAAVGMQEGETSRHSAFCAWAIHSLEVLWIEDTLLDERCSDNPLVLVEPFIRCYAGAPIVTPEGYALGAICVMDYKPRPFDGEVAGMLAEMSRKVSAALDAKRSSVGEPRA